MFNVDQLIKDLDSILCEKGYIVNFINIEGCEGCTYKVEYSKFDILFYYPESGVFLELRIKEGDIICFRAKDITITDVLRILLKEKIYE